MDAKEFGSGKTFGWDAYERDEGKEMLRQLRQILEKEQIQFVLAGGLTPDNVSRGIDIFSPDIVDVSSGVEKEPGDFEAEHSRMIKSGNRYLRYYLLEEYFQKHL